MSRRLKCECGACRTCRYRDYERAKYRLESYGRWEPRNVDARPHVEKVRKLRSQGWTPARLAEMSGGLKADYFRRIARQDIAYMRPATAAAIAKLPEPGVAKAPLQPRPSIVPALGTVRRVQALLALGWRHQDIFARSGVNTRIIQHRDSGRIHRKTRDAIALAYDEMSMSLGPSEKTRTRARIRGYAPPLAWDDEAIDDPKAKPTGVKHAYADVHTRLPDTDILVAEVNRSGVTIVAERYGVTPGAINKVLARRGYRAVTRADQGQLPTYMKKVAA